MRFHFVCFALLCTCGTSAASGTEFFVATDGSDSSPGTANRPFATLAKAREAVGREVAEGLDADVTVWIQGGTYSLPEPLVFGPESGGTEQFAVTYAAVPGERVVLSGGQRITGWRKGDDHVWTAQVATDQGEAISFRNLFVGGRRAVRARAPNQDAQPNCVQLKAAEQVWSATGRARPTWK
jgi:hypothetical protein